MRSVSRSRRLLSSALAAALLLLSPGLPSYQALARTYSRGAAAPQALPGAAAPVLSAPPLALPLGEVSLAPIDGAMVPAAAIAVSQESGGAVAATVPGGDRVSLPPGVAESRVGMQRDEPRAAAAGPTASRREGSPVTSRDEDPGPAVPLLDRLRLPSFLRRLSPLSSYEEASGQAADDFARRLGESPRGRASAVRGRPAAPAREALLPRSWEEPSVRPRAPVPAPDRDRRAEHRSALFAPVLAAVAASLSGLAALGYWTTVSFAPAAAGQAAGIGLAGAILGGAAAVLGGAGLLLAGLAVWDVALFYYVMSRGRDVGDAEFRETIRRELRSWRLHPSTVSTLLKIVKPYRPHKERWTFSFGFWLARSIYLRPEIVRVPWLLRQVLKHELRHYGAHFGRDPPASSNPVLRFLSFLASEILSHFAELRRLKALRSMKVPAIERVLHDAQLSLDLPGPYEMLVIAPAAGQELRDPAAYGPPSGGKARVVSAFPEAAPDAPALASFLKRDENRERFRVAVVPAASSFLPGTDSADGQRLAGALRRINDVYLLSQRLKISGTAPAEHSLEARQFERLSGMLARMRRRGRLDSRRFEELLKELINRISRTELAGLGVAEVLEGLYAALPDKGAVLLPFAATDAGLETVQKLIQYWRAKDEGGFRVERVDLAEGGHVLVARKVEPRVQMWLKPQGEGVIAASVMNVSSDPTLAGSEAGILARAGFGAGEIERFLKAGLKIRHVFDAGAGNKIFVSVPRANAKLLKRYAESAGIGLEPAQGGFKTLLAEAVPLHGVDELWKTGLRGAGGRVHSTDTGLDVDHPNVVGRAESTDLVGEDNKDRNGHGSHVAGIEGADGDIRGMAPEASLRMGKVFSQSGMGALDGDIKASALIDAVQWGADVENQSLGSPGSSDSELAEDMSNLTQRENSRGDKVIVVASAGNSGPFNNTMSQPSVGVHVISVAAATKGQPQPGPGGRPRYSGRPRKSFFGSVGFAEDYRHGRLRWRMKPELTGVGGNVTAQRDTRDVYEHGVESIRSKDAPLSGSDTANSRGTRKSGTSMSGPGVAGIALLVKQAALRAMRAGGEAHRFFKEHLPFAVKMILMRSSADMGVPVPLQGAGFADAPAAVQLAAETFGGPVSSLGWGLLQGLGLVKASAAPAEAPWAWIARMRGLWAAEDRVFEGAAQAALAAARELLERIKASRNPDAPSEEGPEQAWLRQAAADAAVAALAALAARPAGIKGLKQALGDAAAARPEDEGAGRRKALSAEVNRIKQALGDAAAQAFDKRFAELRAEALPELTAGLKDTVWLNRMYAAFFLMNMKAPEAVDALAEAAFNDPDPRVRQTAFMALGETRSHAVDELLRSGLADARADVALYSAYALARHGDAAGIPAVVARTRDDDPDVRTTAAWVLGRLDRRASGEAADALARMVKDKGEIDDIRQLAIASASEIASSRPEAMTDEAVLGLLSEAGPQDFAITRTLSKFFAAAARSKALRDRMNEEPLKGAITDFVHAYKPYVGRPGVLGELVALLARVLQIPLELPSPLPNPDGIGVPGVDAHLGPLHLIVELPSGGEARIERFADLRRADASRASLAASAAGIDPQLLADNGAALQAAMPASQSLWVNVPESKVVAFSEALEAQGYRVRRAAPVYAATHDTGRLSGALEARARTGLTGKGVNVLYIDEGGDPDFPGLAGKVAHRLNFSDEGGPEDVHLESVSHGTHGMTIVGGSPVEGAPYQGMAPGVRFAVIKVLGANGGSEAAVMAGMEAGAALFPDPLKTPVLANLSLGGPGRPDSPLSRLATRLALRNIGIIAAAGNEGPGEGTVGSPANAALATSIAAVDKKGELTFYSSRSRRGGRREVSRANYGGAVDFRAKNPYEIVAGLSTALAKELKDAAGTVLWNGKPLFLHMSGTSMAAPHETGHQALLIERMAAAFPEGLPDGYLLWLDALLSRAAGAVPDAEEHEVGAGLTDLPAALAALEAALQDPARVAAEAGALMAEARAEHGGQPPAEPGGTWFRRQGILERLTEALAASVFLMVSGLSLAARLLN